MAFASLFPQPAFWTSSGNTDGQSRIIESGDTQDGPGVKQHLYAEGIETMKKFAFFAMLLGSLSMFAGCDSKKAQSIDDKAKAEKKEVEAEADKTQEQFDAKAKADKAEVKADEEKADAAADKADADAKAADAAADPANP